MAIHRFLFLWRNKLLLLLDSASAADELHVADHDLGCVPVSSVLRLPFPRLESAFDVDLRALAEVLGSHLAESVEQDNPVPLGMLDGLTRGFVLSGFRSGNPQAGDGAAAREQAFFRIRAQVADDDDLVDR